MPKSPINEVYTEYDLGRSEWSEEITMMTLRDFGFKFIVAKDVDNITLAISTQGIEHSKIAQALLDKKSGASFLGAGEGKIDKINWGSNTCRDMFGFDTPQESSSEENKVLLEDNRGTGSKISGRGIGRGIKLHTIFTQNRKSEYNVES